MSSNVPRRAGLTPTNDGRFRAPPVPISGMRVRRGLTPRSASKKVGSTAPTAIPKRPKLSAAKHLEIIRKIKAGDFRPGEGLQQFYEQEPSSAVSQMTCKQNLFSSFASMDNQPEHPLASSTRNYGSGRGGLNDSLASCMSTSIISSIPSHNSTIRGGSIGCDADLTIMEVPGSHVSENQANNVKNVKEYPPHIAMLDDLIRDKQELFQLLEKTAIVACRAKLSELLPVEKMFMFLKSIDRVQRIIQKYLKGNASENMRMFMPTASPAKGVSTPSFVYCDAEKSTQVIQGFYKIGQILSSLENFCNDSSNDHKLERNIESLKECTNNLEQLIKTQEQCTEDLNDMIKKAEVLDLDAA